MKKLFLSILLMLVLVLGFYSAKTVNAATVTYTSGWTKKSPGYAGAIGYDINYIVWSEVGVYENYFTVPTSDEDGRDYGNTRIYVGVYHTISTEYDIPPSGVPVFYDVFMVFYKVMAYPTDDHNENAYIDYVDTKLDVNALNYWNNIILDWGPRQANAGTTITFGTSVGGSNSMSISESYTIYQCTLYDYTNDPLYHVKYDYTKSKSNTFADHQQDHYGFFVVESAQNAYDFDITFNVRFQDFDQDFWPFSDNQFSSFKVDFRFDMG